MEIEDSREEDVMCRQTVHRFGVCVLTIVMITGSAAQAGKQKWESLVRAGHPVHWYGFNEDAGTTDTEDKGSGGLNGTYRALVDLGQEGLFGVGEAVLFERGGQDDIMWTQGGDLVVDAWTAEFIVKKLTHDVASLCDSPDFSIRVVGWGVNDELSFTEYGVIDAQFDSAGGPDLVAPLDEWIHVTYRKNAEGVQVFLNGVLTGTTSTTIDCPIESFGGRAGGASDGMNGFMDEAVIYDYALTDADIQAHAQAPFQPDIGAVILEPLAGVTDVFRTTGLRWTPGTHAVTHDVYFGTVYSDVNEADRISPMDVLVSSDQDASQFDPGTLDFDQTYYWRVDEVNGAPDKTIFKGDIWRFTVEPYSIQIPGANIVATASSVSNEFSMASSTLDGSGLSPDGTHAIAPETMWFTAAVDLDPWIQYEFEAVKKLDTMTVWNSNSSAESAIGWGVKDVVIETSVDGETWDVLEGPYQISRAPGSPSYSQADALDLAGAAAKYVRLNIQSNWGGILTAYSLSEVQFKEIPVTARTPSPATGSTDISPDDAQVSWRAGREAAQSTVYVSTDPNEVANGVAPSETAETHQFDLNAFGLQMGETYYWRVDEVNEAEIVSVWPGPVWRLALVDAWMVDDFESYGNASPNRPFQTWLDGFGYSADEFFPVGYGGNGTGAGIGHDIWSLSSPHYDGDIMETSIALPGSGQSMALYYSNAGGVASETQRTFAAPQDWTIGGAQTLTISFYGTLGNTGQLFAEINNTKVSYDGDLANIALAGWQTWHIDLSDLGTTLQSVTSLTLGVDGAGAAGLVYFDDIRLVATRLESMIPTEAIEAWKTVVTADTPAFLITHDVDSVYDIGPVSGDISYEFIVRSNPDETMASMGLMGRRGFGDSSVGLKFEQWNNTGTYGATVFGVADHDFGTPTAPGEDTHLVFISSEDAGTTTLYVNGVYGGEIPSAITLNGVTGIGYIASVEDGSASFDNFDGNIFGVAVYDAALSESVIQAHADAFLK